MSNCVEQIFGCREECLKWLVPIRTWIDLDLWILQWKECDSNWDWRTANNWGCCISNLISARGSIGKTKFIDWQFDCILYWQ